MTQHAYETRYRRRRQVAARAASPPGAPPNSGDILQEIFLRLPPLPSSLPRVSLVCKRWRRLAADPEFLLRFRAHHGKAPLLGLFNDGGGWVSFNPVLDPPDRISRERFTFTLRTTDCRGAQTYYPNHGTLLGCRHGRLLILNHREPEVLVCDPITGEQRRIAVPPEFGERSIHPSRTKGAVLCADGRQGHVHGGCHSSPFKVVLVQTFFKEHGGRTSACVYSSETGKWSGLISVAKQINCNVDFYRPATLVGGGSLCWWLPDTYGSSMKILEFDTGRQTLSMIGRLPVPNFDIHCSQIIQGEDGGVGAATLSYPNLQLWDWKVDCGAGVWIMRKAVHLELVPNILSAKAQIVGYVEDDDAILIKVNFNHSIFIVQLDSMQSSKLCETTMARLYHPFTSFYSSGEFGRCKGLASDPSTTPSIEPSKQQAPTLPVGKKARRG